jgi:SAM-dependent methyltransferase
MRKKDQVHKYYFDRPELFEEIHKGRFEKEPKFLMRIFRKYGKVSHILDVGCGTGSHLAKLRAQGLTGIGIDLNEHMIEFARKQYPTIRFERKDMRKLKYRAQFDAVMCLCSTFAYNTTNEDVVASLVGFNKALKKGGLLILDLFNAISLIQRKQFRTKIEETYEKFALGCEITPKIDEDNQSLIETRSIYHTKDNKLVKSDVTEYRLFFPQEMRYFLETNGFKLLRVYGDYDLKRNTLKKSNDKIRLLVIAKKK